MLTVYIIAFWVGFLLTVALAVLGVSSQLHLMGHFGGHLGLHVSDLHASGGADQGAGHHGGPSVFNLYTILAFLTTFGGVGYVLSTTGDVGGVLSLIIAIAVGIVIAWVIFTVLWRLSTRGERAMIPEDYDLVGMYGQLSIGIPSGGVGEMKYVLDGTTRSIGVRSVSEQAIGRGTEVVILEIHRGLATVIEYDRHVHKSSDEQDRTNRL